ncbi:hypothetical protein HAX54_047874 [Datura stramonium]|uniref:Uncharacterized protein n=1 Tax=Datura stramonium TaxID=4076 RepID=A0ABS8ST58_DATST|nr:hypothetical protein [Datura stramonium]
MGRKWKYKPKTGPPQHVINMIIKDSTSKKARVLVSGKKTHFELPDLISISFSSKDLNGLEFSHNNALKISLNIDNFIIKRVLVDPGSLVDIINMRVLEQMKLDPKIETIMKEELREPKEANQDQHQLSRSSQSFSFLCPLSLRRCCRSSLLPSTAIIVTPPVAIIVASSS